MSFLAKLNIDDASVDLLDCSFNINQGADYSGKPSRRSQGGQITINIEGSKKIDFLEWIVSEKTIKEGEIIFYKRDSLSTLKKIKFKDAYCLNYKETFDADNGQPLKIIVVLSAKSIGVDDAKYDNLWFSKN